MSEHPLAVIDADGHSLETAAALREHIELPYQDIACDTVSDSQGNGFFLASC